MKRRFIFLLFFAMELISFTACNKTENKVTALKDSSTGKISDSIDPDKKLINSENLTGSWISVDYKMGFDLKSGGIVNSINMATLDYNSWEIIENKLILNSTSKGVSNPVSSKEIYIIREIYSDSLILSPSNYPERKITYTKN